MKMSISENIKNYRKQKNFTQEQLAEAMGVSVGAVSKWESGSSVPELSLIMELADFFEISVDALLGYRLRDNSAEKTAERIKSLRVQKEYNEGLSEAEKAIQKFPNDFEVIYQSASLYMFCGIDRMNQEHILRAKELCEHSLRLYNLRKDNKISKLDIYSDLSTIYSMLGNHEKSLDILKENNEGGIFDYSIGYTLAADFKKYDEAMPYLCDAFVTDLTKLFYIFLGFANVYAAKKNYSLALEALLTIKNLYDSLHVDGKNSYLDKSTLIILMACAQMCENLEDEIGIRKYLLEAKEIAERFNLAPDYTARNIKFYYKENPATSADDIGETGLEAITNMVDVCKTECPMLNRIWQEINPEQ